MILVCLDAATFPRKCASLYCASKALFKVYTSQMPSNENNFTGFWGWIIALGCVDELKYFPNSLEHLDTTTLKDESALGAVDLEVRWRLNAW